MLCPRNVIHSCSLHLHNRSAMSSVSLQPHFTGEKTEAQHQLAVEPTFEPGRCTSVCHTGQGTTGPGRGGRCSHVPWWAHVTAPLRGLETSVRTKSSPRCALKKGEKSPFHLPQGREPVMLDIEDGPSSGSTAGIKPGPATSDRTDTSVSFSGLVMKGNQRPNHGWPAAPQPGPQWWEGRGEHS